MRTDHESSRWGPSAAPSEPIDATHVTENPDERTAFLLDILSSSVVFHRFHASRRTSRRATARVCAPRNAIDYSGNEETPIDRDNGRPAGLSPLPQTAGKVDSRAVNGIQGRSVTPISELATPQTGQSHSPGVPCTC